MCDKELYLSEVHIDSTQHYKERFITRFEILINAQNDDNCKSNEIEFETDVDGDICLNQNKCNEKTKLPITVQHSGSTNLENVGSQIWKASFLLADYILDTNIFNDSLCIELGCGIGLVSIIACLKVKHIYVTDFNIDVLKLCYENLEDNNDVNIFDKNTNSNDEFFFSETFGLEEFRCKY